MKHVHNKEQSYFPIHKLYNEESRKQPITKSDIRKTLTLFKEFHIELPLDFEMICNSFTSYRELENWRRNYIVNHLKECRSFGGK